MASYNPNYESTSSRWGAAKSMAIALPPHMSDDGEDTPLLLMLRENIFWFSSLLERALNCISDPKSSPPLLSPALVREGLLYSRVFLLWIHLLLNISKQSGDR